MFYTSFAENVLQDVANHALIYEKSCSAYYT